MKPLAATMGCIAAAVAEKSGTGAPVIAMPLSPKNQQSTAAFRPDIDLRNIRILLVDPNNLSAIMTQDSLVLMGATRVYKCLNTDRALSVIDMERIDLIFVEFNTI